jgi:hypothetical protein
LSRRLNWQYLERQLNLQFTEDFNAPEFGPYANIDATARLDSRRPNEVKLETKEFSGCVKGDGRVVKDDTGQVRAALKTADASVLGAGSAKEALS